MKALIMKMRIYAEVPGVKLFFASIPRRLQIGVSWSLVGAVINAAITFAVAVLLARLLGKEGFGEYVVVQSTMLTVAGVAQLATGFTANKYIAEFRTSDKMRTARIIGFCSMVSWITAIIALITIILSARWLAVVMLDQPQLASSFLAASAMIFFSVLNGYQLGALAGLESYKQIAKITVLGAGINLVACGMGAWLAGLEGVAIGLSVSALTQWLIARVELTKEARKEGVLPIYRWATKEKSIFFKFALPAAISGFFSLPALWMANLFLVRTSDGMEQMAVFAAASTLRSLVLFLPAILNRVSTSLLNNHRGLSESGEYKDAFRLNLILTSGVAVLGAITIAIVGPWLLGMFGKSFQHGYPVLLIGVTTIEVIFQAVYQLVQSNEKMWLSLLTIVVPRDVSIVILAMYLVPKWGAVGLASAYGFSWLLALMLVINLSFRIGLVPHKANV